MSTKIRLLEAAIPIFADNGYHRATISAICAAAEANIAAVNYHFGSKDVLYAEAWRHALYTSLHRHPPDGGVPTDAPVEQQFRGRLRAVLDRVIDPDSMEFVIMTKEMANRTGLLDVAVRDDLGPLMMEMRKLVARLVAPASEQVVNQCTESVAAQVFHTAMRYHKKDGPPFPIPQSDPKDLIEHITEFSLAGIRGIAARAAAQEKAAGGGDANADA